jgi:hypothetical protein
MEWHEGEKAVGKADFKCQEKPNRIYLKACSQTLYLIQKN